MSANPTWPLTQLRQFRQRGRERFARWVNRRIPAARSVTLDQRRIFIFPSRVGLFFGVCLLVMLMTAINFENNLSYALTFWLATLFIIATLHTYANLSGLTIRALRAKPAFAGQHAEFELLVERAKRRDHYGLHVTWPGGSEVLVNLLEDDAARISLHVPVEQRGWVSPGRLLIESTYPLGLLRCWTWIDLDIHALVYPKPLAIARRTGSSTENPEGSSLPILGSDDFSGLRDYQKGDSPRHIYWKALAKGQGVQTKQYAAYADHCIWLDWDLFPGLGIEQRLSHLCYWALEFDRGGEDYGLRLPELTMQPSSGEAHKEAVLRALAVYGSSEAPS